MKFWQLQCFLGCAASLVFATPSAAQTNSMFGDRGPASQIGSNLNGSIVGSTTTLGQPSSTGLTGQPLGGNGSATQLGTGVVGNAGATGTQSGFIGARDNAGQLVGNQLAGQQNAGAATGNLRGGFANRGNTTGGGNQNGRNSGERPRTVIRPRQVVAFSFPRPTQVAIRSTLETRFSRWVSRSPEMQGVTVRLTEPGVVVLEGEVADAATSRLVAMLARLEPGVREVRNELAVQAPVASP